MRNNQEIIGKIEELRRKNDYSRKNQDYYRMYYDIFTYYDNALDDVLAVLKEQEFPKEPPVNYDGYLDNPNLRYI